MAETSSETHVLEVMARGWESLNAKAEVARVHRDGHCLEAMMWNRPLEDFGRWQIRRELPKGDDPRTDHRKGADSNLPGWQPKETASSLPNRADCFINATPYRSPDAVGWAPLVGRPLTTSLRGLWVSGYLPRAMADRAQGRRPENRP